MRYAAAALLLAAPALLAAAACLSRGASRVVCAALALLLAGTALEAYVLCPRRLEVVACRLQAPAGISLGSPLRLVLVSDIQTDAVGSFEERALETAAALHPDLLFFAGDFLHVF